MWHPQIERGGNNLAGGERRWVGENWGNGRGEGRGKEGGEREMEREKGQVLKMARDKEMGGNSVWSNRGGNDSAEKIGSRTPSWFGFTLIPSSAQ